MRVRALQVKYSATGNHFTAVIDEGGQDFFEVQRLGLTISPMPPCSCRTRSAQLGMSIEVVQHHFGDFAATQLNQDPHAVLVGFIAPGRDAFDTSCP